MDGSTKLPIMDVKMNSPLRAECFLDDSTLVTSGVDAEVYVWDLRYTARCLTRCVRHRVVHQRSLL